MKAPAYLTCFALTPRPQHPNLQVGLPLIAACHARPGVWVNVWAWAAREGLDERGYWLVMDALSDASSIGEVELRGGSSSDYAYEVRDPRQGCGYGS